RAGPLMSWDARLLLFFSSRRRHTRSKRDWSSDVCSSDRLVSLRWFVGGRRGRRHHPRRRCRRRLPTLVVQVLMVGGTLLLTRVVVFDFVPPGFAFAGDAHIICDCGDVGCAVFACGLTQRKSLIDVHRFPFQWWFGCGPVFSCVKDHLVRLQYDSGQVRADTHLVLKLLHELVNLCRGHVRKIHCVCSLVDWVNDAIYGHGCSTETALDFHVTVLVNKKCRNSRTRSSHRCSYSSVGNKIRVCYATENATSSLITVKSPFELDTQWCHSGSCGMSALCWLPLIPVSLEHVNPFTDQHVLPPAGRVSV